MKNRQILVYQMENIEKTLRSYGFQGPQRSMFGDFYVGTFGRFDDLFDVRLEVMDAPEHGKEYKRILIHCNPITGDCKKTTRMVRHILKNTGINERRVNPPEQKPTEDLDYPLSL